ncbi:MAG: hypothetical protein OXG96_07030, partial [Acidobacteria bacterium]|nr:hypothetical protein [Acidobacteriota bacterium]
GIEIPFPHRSLYFGEVSKAFATRSVGADPGEIKAMIREVLEEKGLAAGKVEPPAPTMAAPAAPKPEARPRPAKPPAERRPRRPAPLGESTADSEGYE